MKTSLHFLFLIALSVVPLQAYGNQHPLDPLSWKEYWTVLEVLQEAGRLDDRTRFSMINLKEPDKELVWQWSDGDPIPRSAFALVRQQSKTYEAIVNINERQLTSWKELVGVQPNWLGEEFKAMEDAVKEHPEVISAMRRRGFEDFAFIDMDVVPPGYFGTEEQRGRRIGHVQFNDTRGVRNVWTRRIEGLTVVLDLQEKKVLRVVDEGVVPIPTAVADYDMSSVGTIRKVEGPMHVEQPLGPGFTMNGYQVEWQNWRFHVRPDQRVGMIISTVTYEDGDKIRPVLYQGFLSEMFVPYMDPAFSWYVRNFFDAGEFSVGGLSKPLLPGIDCPDHTIYLDALVAGDNGRPRTVPNIIGIFERETGDMSWRHWSDGASGGPEGRVKRDLVVRTVAVLGNYDYVFDWIFQQNGSIEVAVGATGIAETKMVVQEKALAAGIGGGLVEDPADAFGRFVDRHIVAVNHDHYFNFRLDLDVDGTSNSFLIDRLVTERLPDSHPRRSVWVNRPELARHEVDGQLNINLDRPALWRVISTSNLNEVGYPTSYQLMPGRNTNTLLSPDDYPRRRAGFIEHHLWVTPYRNDELYAAGDYPTLSEPGMGLPQWTSNNRPIENTDIVLWHTIGMHHMVRAEDWPVMPVLWRSFELRPFDFFDRNPALDLPR